MAGFLKDVGKQAARNIGASLSRTGILGAAIGKTFAKKFGEDQEDTQVADAIKEQSVIQEENSASLTRIESVVTNISDNVYNLAAVMNAHVVTLQEAQRIQKEKAFKQAAAAEEAAAEATKIGAPDPSGTADSGDKKKGGMLSGIMDSVASTKNMFKGFLKKFAVVAVGVTAALGVAAGVSALSDKGEEEPTSATEEPKPVEQPPEPPPEATRVSSAESESPNSMISSFTGAISKFGGSKGAEDAPAVGNMIKAGATGDMGGFMAAAQAHSAKNPPPPAAEPAATPAAPPPPVAASGPDPEVEKLKEFFQRPENAGDNARLGELQNTINVIKRAISSTKSLISSATTPEEKARHEDILKNQLEPGLEAAKKEKKAILDKGRQAVGISTAPKAPGASTSDTSSAPTGTQTAGPSGGGGSPMGSGGGASAAPVTPPPPSTGADVASASTAVAAASEPQQPKNEQVNMSSSNDTGSPPPASIPSPIADRGSLDNDTIFNAGG